MGHSILSLLYTLDIRESVKWHEYVDTNGWALQLHTSTYCYTDSLAQYVRVMQALVVVVCCFFSAMSNPTTYFFHSN